MIHNSRFNFMNKYFIIGILIAVVIGGGVIYRNFLLPEGSAPVTTGVVREITIIAQKDDWRFIPEVVEVDRGDTIIATVINEDSYDHGIAIDALGISQRMPANSTIKIKFDATQSGDFPFYCSVPCGEGDTPTGHRTHFDMIGTIKVKDVVKTE